MAGMCNVQSCRTRSIPGTNVTECDYILPCWGWSTFWASWSTVPMASCWRSCPAMDFTPGPGSVHVAWMGCLGCLGYGWAMFWSGNHRPAMPWESQVFPCWASRITSCRWRFSWSLLVDRFRWRETPIALPGLHLSGWSCHTCQQFPDFLSEDPVAANWGLQGSSYLPQLNWTEVLLLDDQSADPVFARLHRCVYHCRNPDPLGPPVGPLVALVALARGECEVRLHEEFRQQSSQPLFKIFQVCYTLFNSRYSSYLYWNLFVWLLDCEPAAL